MHSLINYLLSINDCLIELKLCTFTLLAQYCIMSSSTRLVLENVKWMSQFCSYLAFRIWHLETSSFESYITKHAYSNILKISPPKTENFQIKILIFFILLSKHRLWVLVRTASANQYPQSMFLSKNKENNVYPCKLQFSYVKVGFKGVNIIQASFRDVLILWNILSNAYLLYFTALHEDTELSKCQSWWSLECTVWGKTEE